MLRAIPVDNDLSVIVTFSTRDVTRLTPAGFELGQETICSLHDAHGYGLLDHGRTLRAQEDCPDEYRAMRLSLERAAQKTFPGDGPDKVARTKLHAALEKAIREERAAIREVKEMLDGQ